MVFGRTHVRKSSAILQEFIDPSYLSNKRPAVPGGSWSKELLRKKSFADLQQLWFALVKEKNMLATTKHHYLVHQEELGAFPAPNRILMVDESMLNIKAVVQERDFEATDRATAIFKERLNRGVYRFPPGPQPPASHQMNVSKVRFDISKKIGVERLREIFGKYDVFEEHKGIANITVSLSQDALREKKAAEVAWDQYISQKRQYDGYHAFDKVDSVFDHTEVQLAPGVLAGSSSGEKASILRAVDVEVPQRAEQTEIPTKPLERLQFMSKSSHARVGTNYSYFPIRSNASPEPAPERPTHPDEIDGPWNVTITYDENDGFGYFMSLEVNTVDGAVISNVKEVDASIPFARRCPVYMQAKRALSAEQENTHNWPHVPTWKNAYNKYTKRNIADVIHYNYSNVVDYVDREVLLTGKSSWEMPIPIDTSCGGGFNVPAHAKNPKTKTFTSKKFSRF